ncbi:hypothetical protein ACSBPQ_03965 [Stenotrophomonas sp. JC08]|uniref:hypothetical protein n=1 Tax=Stenotrophomonas sp. JC08 TaxID=3445779 RepID=UPI003FA24D19
MLIYTLALIFFIIPITLLAYRRIKAERYPLPSMCNNVVVNRAKLRKSIGIASPILFWVFHVLFLLYSVVIEAWISSLALIAYMAVSTLLSHEMKQKGVGVIPEVGVGAGQPPSLPPEQ